jgi:uncharacterized protein (DUF983 family)
MSYISSTPSHCPGFQQLKNLKTFMCTCNHCGAPKEIFSDEFDRPHTCQACGKEIDFSKCTIDGEAKSTEPE